VWKSVSGWDVAALTELESAVTALKVQFNEVDRTPRYSKYRYAAVAAGIATLK